MLNYLNFCVRDIIIIIIYIAQVDQTQAPPSVRKTLVLIWKNTVMRVRRKLSFQ